MKKFCILLLLVNLLACENSPDIEDYYDIANTIIIDQLETGKTIQIFEGYEIPDTIFYREFKLFEIPQDDYIYDSLEQNLTINSISKSIRIEKNGFPSISDIMNYKEIDFNQTLMKWDSASIISCDLIHNENFKIDDQSDLLGLGVDKSQDYDFLLLSYPLLNSTKDTTLVISTMYTENYQIHRAIKLANLKSNWKIFEKIILINEIRVRIISEEDWEKREIVAIVKGSYDELN